MAVIAVPDYIDVIFRDLENNVPSPVAGFFTPMYYLKNPQSGDLNSLV